MLLHFASLLIILKLENKLHNYNTCITGQNWNAECMHVWPYSVGRLCSYLADDLYSDFLHKLYRLQWSSYH